MARSVIVFPTESFSLVIDSSNSIKFWASESMLKGLNCIKICCGPHDSCFPEDGCYYLDSSFCRKSNEISFILYNGQHHMPEVNKAKANMVKEMDFLNLLNYVGFKDSLSFIGFCKKNNLEIRGSCQFAVNGRFHLQKLKSNDKQYFKLLLPQQLRKLFDRCRWVYTTF